MASLNGTFDATEVAPAVPLEVLPPGKYLAHLIESEMLPTKAGDGQLLKLVFEVLEGPSARRKIFDQLNLVNRNEQTVEIAQRTLSAICHATGKLQVNDSEELHLIPMTIQVGVKPPKDGYGERNTIRYLVPEAPAQATPPKPDATQPASAPAQSAPARPATAPWNRKS